MFSVATWADCRVGSGLKTFPAVKGLSAKKLNSGAFRDIRGHLFGKALGFCPRDYHFGVVFARFSAYSGAFWLGFRGIVRGLAGAVGWVECRDIPN